MTVYTANQQGADPFTPIWIPAQSSSLIHGLVPTTANGTFNNQGRSVNSLTTNINLRLNAGGTQCSNFCSAGPTAGTQIIYTLTNSGSGFNLTNVTVYGGWTDSGRDAQDYAVLYATAANPTNFILLSQVNYAPTVTVDISLQTVISNATGGLIAANVYALEFLYSKPPTADVPNHWSGYGAITVAGGLASGVVSPVVTLTTANLSGGTPLTTGWTAEAPSLIHGLFPSTATGNLLQPTGSGGTSVLTDGAIGVSGNQTNFVSCGGGVGGNAACTTLIYTLTNVINGTDLTNIVVYSGWGDTGRFGQYYILSYATLANPTTFVPITTVYYWPGLLNGGG